MDDFFAWLIQPFTGTPQQINSYRLLGRPVKVSSSPDQPKYLYLYADNFFLGSCWGLVSGNTSGAFFKKPISVRFLTKGRAWFAGLLAVRVVRRMTLAGLLFHAVERKAAENLELGMRSSASSNLAGFAVLAAVFRVAKKLSESIFISSFILGGYIVGTRVASVIRESMIHTRREDHPESHPPLKANDKKKD